MKRTLAIVLVLLQAFNLAGQIRIKDFQPAVRGTQSASLEFTCTDLEGDPCAVLALKTDIAGWTFDTGLSGIMDTRYDDGCIYLYVPKDTRSLTVSHPQYGVLREWRIPSCLESGRTYTMALGYEAPRPVRFRTETGAAPVLDGQTRTRSVTAVASGPSATPFGQFSEHFLDMYLGVACEGNVLEGCDADTYWLGLSYTWIGNRFGPYVSAGTDLDESYAFSAGAAFRVTDPRTASLDWQLYAGAGLYGGCLGFEAGMRFGWRTPARLSKADFGFGCQFYGGTVVPAVSVGFYIWGIPVAVGVGLVCCAAGV